MRSKLLPLSLLLSIFCSAQDSSFQIKDYKYRTPGFRALALNINLSGNYTKNSVDKSTFYRSNNTTLGPATASYYQIKSSNQKLQQTTISLSTDYSNYSKKESSQNEGYKRFSTDGAWQITTKNYKQNQWFFEWGNAFSGSLGSFKVQIPSSTSKSTSNDFSVNNTVTIGVGKGRIEWVQDAQMALYILQDLASQNLLSRKPTVEETNAFAQLVTDIRNRRVFDSRRRRIYELTRIDSFLRNNRLITQPDIRHFTTVNDNWSFAINPFRQSGKSWFARLKPGISYRRGKNDNESLSQPLYHQSKLTTLYFSPEIGYEIYKPVNLKWQRNFQVAVYYLGQQYYQTIKSVSNNNESIVKTDGYGGGWNLNSTYGIGYYPNTRTQLVADVGLRGSYNNSNTWSVQPSINLSADYFIGYRTFLNATISSSYLISQQQNLAIRPRYEYFSSGFSVKLSHYLF